MKKAPFRCFSFICNQYNHWLVILLQCRTFEQFIKQMFSQKQHRQHRLKDFLLVSVSFGRLSLQFINLALMWNRFKVCLYQSIQSFQILQLLTEFLWNDWFCLELDQISFQSVVVSVSLFELMLLNSNLLRDCSIFNIWK